MTNVTNPVDVITVDATKRKKPIFKIIVWSLIALVAIRLIMASVHPYVIEARKYTGFSVLILGMIILYTYLMFKKTIPALTKLIVTVVVVLMGVGVYFAKKPLQEFMTQMYYENMYKSLHLVELPQGQFPLIGSSRIQPRDNIYTKGYETVQQNVDVSMPHLMRHPIANKTYWCMSILPAMNATMQRYFDNITSMYSIPSDATGFAMKDYKKDVNFSTTDHSHFFKGTTWNAILKMGFKYFYMEPGQVFYGFNDKGTPIQITTLIKWEGFFIPTPKFGGVIVEESRELTLTERIGWPFIGIGKYYSPDDIQKISYLKNQNLIDEAVSREWAESFTYKDGYMDAVITKINQIEIPHFSHETNKAPYVVEVDWKNTGLKNASGLYHYIPLEAKGEAKTGLAMSLLIPSDGTDKIYVYDHAKYEDGVFSITAVPGKVRDQKSDQSALRDWSRSEVVEILPYVIDVPGKKFPDNFYWKSVILTKRSGNSKQFDGATEPLITLTNATNSKVTFVDAAHPETWRNTILYGDQSSLPMQQSNLFKQQMVIDTMYVDQNGKQIEKPVIKKVVIVQDSSKRSNSISSEKKPKQ